MPKRKEFKYPPNAKISFPDELGNREVKFVMPAPIWSPLGDAVKKSGREMTEFLSYAILEAVVDPKQLLWIARNDADKLRRKLNELGYRDQKDAH